ncbi:hypothetical protein DPMN_178747 [Dreissena polymorpha]|uniref:Uncharacterized protein n=1 Tax=Dreissena polymorpha TaxID=45954 RepID=A0A9D4ILR0_DREPO|nr:hypothetical protein DPMN_178710 [Dreissena polymorpha]KAH3777307.1 hypothetical protein DPMN_178747 [Dreissena polymorpha]
MLAVHGIESPFHAPTRVLTPTGTNEFPLKEGSYHFGNSAGLQYEATEIRRCLLEGKLLTSFQVAVA